MDQRGFTLLEVLVCAAIASTLLFAGIEISAAAKPLASRTAAMRFDAALNYARALAASNANGATVVVSEQQLAVYAGRPTSTDALTSAPMPPVSLNGARVSEAAAGPAPFALFVDGEGRVTAAAFDGATPAPMAPEPPCPPSGSWTVTFADPRASVARTLACTAPRASP